MEKVSSARVALKWGLIYGVFSIFVTTLIYQTEIWKANLITFLITFILLFAVLYLAIRELRFFQDGHISFKESLSMSMLCLTSGLMISIAFDFFYCNFINPDIITEKLMLSRLQYESTGISNEQIEMQLVKSKYILTSSVGFLILFLVFIFFGFIASLIMSAIMKKDKPVFS